VAQGELHAIGFIRHAQNCDFAHLMRVDRTHQVDRFPPDPDQVAVVSYVYDVFRFSDGDLTLVGRSYASDPQDAHLLRREVGSSYVGPTARDTQTPLFVAAVAYFRSVGMVRVTWLNAEGEGYEPVPIET
jgi:hypothetical protein